MKRLIFTMIVICACQMSFAQNMDAVYNEFKDVKGVESVSVSPLLMKFARLFMDNDDKNNPLIKGTHSVKVLDLEDCTKDIKKQFTQKVSQLEHNGYETWMQVKEDGENVKIIAKMEDQMIRELLVLTTGNDDCALVLIKGKIKQEDIQAIIDDDKIMIDGRK